MPTIIRVKGYRLFFVSLNGSDPTHVHVRRGAHLRLGAHRAVLLCCSRGALSPRPRHADTPTERRGYRPRCTDAPNRRYA